MKNKMTFIMMGYGIVALALFLFSYTQTDLNLTLSRASVFQSIQKSFQYVGYYQRPLSTAIYIGIVLGLFGLYGSALRAAINKELSVRDTWGVIALVTVLLVFSYPAAFSYDFFNYLFTAKTVLIYHKNPYLVTPLQFAGIDPWTNFMRWTHLSSAYAPVWIGLSLIPFVLGFGYFLPVLLSTKLFIASFYIVTCIGIVRIMQHEDAKHTATSLVLFALNPLVIIETLVSGHNDIVLVAFAMLAVSLFAQRRYLSAWWMLALSVAAKFMTIFLVPVFLFRNNRTWMLGAMCLGLTIVLFKREFLPWYWVWIMPFVAILPNVSWIVPIASAISFGLLLSYIPYLYFGHYNLPVPVWKLVLTWTPIVIVSIILLAIRIVGKNERTS